MTRIAIFASGTGSNAAKIIDYFRHHSTTGVFLIVCNKSGAGVTAIAHKEKLPLLLIDKQRFVSGDAYVPELRQHEINFIVLAGFLWKIPSALLEAYPGSIVNIHPALLPRYGGKGMYGMRVHEAVINNRDTVSGITIHFVDEHYDNGDIIFQDQCPVEAGETPESLAAKVHALEHTHFPRVIEQVVSMQNQQSW